MNSQNKKNQNSYLYQKKKYAESNSKAKHANNVHHTNDNMNHNKSSNNVQQENGSTVNQIKKENKKPSLPIENISNNTQTNNFAFTFSNKFKDTQPPQITISSSIFPNPQTQLQDANPSEYDIKQMNENDKKLKESLQLYNNLVRKNEGAGINTLFKIRTILINWLKDSDQDLEYSKFMTEKKIRYLLKNKEKMESRIKSLESDLVGITERKKELENILGDLYVNYEEDELKTDINRFENSYEIKSGKCSKTKEKLEEMKKMLPYVSEMGKVKENESQKSTEKKELERILKSSNQTLVFLSNYYKNIKKKISEL